MDPLSLIAMASTTFKGIQTLVNRGAEIEAVAQKLGAFYGYASDIKNLEREAESPSIFRKLFNGQSVEAQALNSLVASRKLAEQEKMVRELIVWTYGVEAYQEMISLRREIKARREKVIYKQRKRQRMVLDGVFLFLGALVVFGVISGVVYIVSNA